MEAGRPLPPPSYLKRRIIIKNKKKHHHHGHGHGKKSSKKPGKGLNPENGESPPMLSKDDSKDSVDLEDTSTCKFLLPFCDFSNVTIDLIACLLV